MHLLAIEKSGHLQWCTIDWSLVLVLMELYIAPVKQKFQRKIVIIFLNISLNMCFGCSKEPSHGSFDYPQHKFLLRNKKNIIFHYTPLAWGLTTVDSR